MCAGLVIATLVWLVVFGYIAVNKKDSEKEAGSE